MNCIILFIITYNPVLLHVTGAATQKSMPSRRALGEITNLTCGQVQLIAKPRLQKLPVKRRQSNLSSLDITNVPSLQGQFLAKPPLQKLPIKRRQSNLPSLHNENVLSNRNEGTHIY